MNSNSNNIFEYASDTAKVLCSLAFLIVIAASITCAFMYPSFLTFFILIGVVLATCSTILRIVYGSINVNACPINLIENSLIEWQKNSKSGIVMFYIMVLASLIGHFHPVFYVLLILAVSQLISTYMSLQIESILAIALCDKIKSMDHKDI